MFLLIIIAITLLSFKFYKWIAKHQLVFYIIATLLAAIAFFARNIPITKPINIGMVGLAFFYVVLIVGVLPKKWKFAIPLRALRKEWSIVGFLLITPHSLYNLYNMLFNGKSFTWFGIVTFGIMVPLFITSFTVIRKKMTPKSWKFLQSFAYLSYIGLFIHIILNASQLLNLVAYLVAFIPYLIVKSILLLRTLKIKLKK